MSLFDFISRKKEPVQLPYSTDIHSHILPGVDDGAPDIDTSVFLAQSMAKWGIRHAITTPHVSERFENTPDILDPALDELKKSIRESGVDIRISRSSENRIDDYFYRLLHSGLITPFPSNYLLVENSFYQEPIMLDKFLFDLKMSGYNPIIAHPERYHYYHSGTPDRYRQLHRAGNLFQINILSLAGAYGKDEKRAAEKLIENELVDFLATDLHSPFHVEIIDSYLRSKDARRHFSALAGRLLNDRLFNFVEKA